MHFAWKFEFNASRMLRVNNFLIEQLDSVPSASDWLFVHVSGMRSFVFSSCWVERNNFYFLSYPLLSVAVGWKQPKNHPAPAA